MKQIALQLYSIRAQAAFDFEKAVRRIAAMGYGAVETAGFPGTTPETAAKLFHSLGLTVTSAHEGNPLGAQQKQILETIDALGKPALVCTDIGRGDVKNLAAIQKLCERLNAGYEVARAHGIRYGIHNHWWEFGQVDGRMVHEIMLELLDPGIFLELDTYWIKVAGQDPVSIIRRLGERVPMLHIKDGPGTKDDPMTAVGDGIMDVPAIFNAAAPNAWAIVEMDRCATNVMDAVEKSYHYLSGL